MTLADYRNQNDRLKKTIEGKDKVLETQGKKIQKMEGKIQTLNNRIKNFNDKKLENIAQLTSVVF